VPENFDRPYFSASITEFWRRWHMSLTSWMTDYVYKPLGGNRRGLVRTVVNLLVTMLVSGLWHGAAWHFVAWGLYHGVLLGLHRAWTVAVSPRILGPIEEGDGPASVAWRRTSWLRKGLSVATTFALVTIGWGLFVLPADRYVALLAGMWGG
jgi:alginate O-acetyltransferase complex protein AlgI